MNKRLLLIVTVAIVTIFIFISSISQKYTVTKIEKDGKLKIVTTLFPLYDIAKNIGKGKADVSLLLPPGMEAHSFEPKPSDILKINEADIFIYTGKFMEPWVEDILKSVSNEKLLIVNASDNVNIINKVSVDRNVVGASSDPHIWLDLKNTEIMTENIKQAFIKKDNMDISFYEVGARDYIESLKRIDDKYIETFSNCKNKEIIYGGHYAFGYMANRYNLKYSSAQGISPDSEPTAEDLVDLVKQIRKNNIKYIFYEEISSPKIAEVIARETNTKMIPLNPAHNLSREQFISDISFFDILYNNLENLKEGICQ